MDRTPPTFTICCTCSWSARDCLAVSEVPKTYPLCDGWSLSGIYQQSPETRMSSAPRAPNLIRYLSIGRSEPRVVYPRVGTFFGPLAVKEGTACSQPRRTGGHPLMDVDVSSAVYNTLRGLVLQTKKHDPIRRNPEDWDEIGSNIWAR